MKSKVLIAALVAIIITAPVSTFAATPKAGIACNKAGQIQNYSGKKFTCIKSGKKLVWNKGVLIKSVPAPQPTVSPSPEPAASPSPSPSSNSVLPSPSPSPTPTVTATPAPLVTDWSKTFSSDDGYRTLYNNPCQREENIAPQWSDLQNTYLKYQNCIWPIHVAKYELGKQRPSTTLSIENSLPIEQCKISEPANSNALRGFYFNWSEGGQNWVKNRMIPGTKMIIQMIPIYADDTAKPKNSPEEDYSRYTNFIKEWVLQSADNGANIEVRYPKNYLKFSGNLGSYGIYHENRHDSPQHVRFNKDLVSQVDSEIDFSGANLAIIVTTPGTPLNTLEQGTIGELVTGEGRVAVSTTEFPYTLENLNTVKFKNLMLPYWWIHELFHSGIGFTDHYGDDARNVNTEYGLGWWTLMTPGGGDLSAWEKWVIQFIDDKQVNCVAPNTTSVTWIAPSSVKTTEKKLTIIPISKYKGIAIESIRPSGLYYKLPSSSLGVLVYEIDLEVRMGDAGLKLVLPTNRDPNKGPYFLGEATLRLGESVVTNGQKITVIESGNYGDVVKVEKA